MDSRQLEYFLTLVKQGSMSRAADLLNISQSALSKIISRLESEVGVPLFDRHGNRITLNEYGKNFSLYAARALEVLERGLYSTRQSMYDTMGRICITCHAYAGILSDVAADYHFLNPGVQFHVSRHPDRTAMPRDDDDFLLCSGSESASFLEHDNWVAQELFQEEFVAVVSSRFRQYPEDCTSIPLSSLKDAGFISMMDSSPLYSDITFTLCSAAGFYPSVAFQTNDHMFKLDMIGAGRAVSILPECCVDAAKKLHPEIRAFRLEGMNPSRSVYLMRRKRLLLSETALDFWNFVLDFYGLPQDTRD